MYVSAATAHLGNAWKTMRRFPCTASMLIAIWLMFVVELHMHALGNQAMLLRLGALSADSIVHRQYWRLLTYALLHSAWWHIGLNTFLLLMAGPVIESALGARSTLVISILGALLGGMAIVLVHRGETASIGVGASGASFALLGAGVVMTWQRPPESPPRVYQRLRTILIVGLVISFIPGISMAAHLAGVAVGCAYALATRYWARTD
jgi:rhomboid protease GluP